MAFVFIHNQVRSRKQKSFRFVFIRSWHDIFEFVFRTWLDSSCDNAAVSESLKFLIYLGDGYDSIESLLSLSSGWFTPAVFLSTSYIKINCMKNSLKYLKTVYGVIKLRKLPYVSYNSSSYEVVFLPFILTAILSSRSI